MLKGVQRVPSLLLLKPDQKLCNLNLQNYCEPMHDIKGHLLNLFEELPSILPASVKAICETCINICLGKEKKSAADLRATVIRLHMIVMHVMQINALLQSIVIASEILYAPDSERCPKLLLRLYNNL